MLESVSELAAAVATAGILVFSGFAWSRPRQARTRSFALLATGLALWTGSLLVAPWLPAGTGEILPWLVALALPPLGLGFVTAHRVGESRWIRRCLGLTTVTAAGFAAALLLLGPRAIQATALVLFPSLALLLVALMGSRKLGMEPGRRRGFPGLVLAGAVATAAGLVDALPRFGVGSGPDWPVLTPLAALFLVGVLATTVARHEFLPMGDLLGRGVGLAVVAFGAAALAVLPGPGQEFLSRWLWVWLLFLLAFLVHPALLRFMSSPFRREREQRKQKLLGELLEYDRVLAESSDAARLVESTRRFFAAIEGVELLAIREEPRPAGGASPPEERAEPREPRDLPDPSCVTVALRVHDRALGEMRVRLAGADLARDREVRRRLEAIGAELAIALRALTLQEQQLRQAHLARLGTMATGIAHEIKNPLGAILGAVDLVEEGGLAEDDRRWLGIVRDESRRLARFVGDVLAYGRPASPRPVATDLVVLVRELGARQKEAAAASGVVLEVEAPAGPLTVFVDPDQLHQALLNLVLNAIEAQPDGGAVRLELEESPRAVRVLVLDRGPGLAPEVRETVLDPFVTTRPGGTGLGLANVARIVESHGGSLRLETGRGEYPGVRAVVELPR
jgi:signal transduction histidine kinase